MTKPSVAIEIDPSETLATKDTFEEDPEEYNDDEVWSNKETEGKGKKESTTTIKEKEVAAKHKAKGKFVATEEKETPNQYGPENAYSYTFYDIEKWEIV